MVTQSPSDVIRWIITVLIFPLGLLLIAEGVDRSLLFTSWNDAQGQVVRLEPGVTLRGRTAYHRVYRFQLPDGRSFEAQDPAGGPRDDSEIGDTVRLVYDPKSPTSVRTLDLLLVCFLLGFGAALCLISVSQVVAAIRHRAGSSPPS